MKPSKLELLLRLFGLGLLVLGLFSEPLGLSEPLQWCALTLAPACFILLFILQRRRRNARLAAGLPPTERPPAKSKLWLLLVVIAAVTLSGPFWLPYTGTNLPTSTLVVTSVISCGFAVLLLVFSWRYWNKKV